MSDKKKVATTGSSSDQVRIRVPRVDVERMRYWAERAELSINDYVAEAIDEKCRRDAGEEVGNSTLLINRVNELIDLMKSQTTEVGNLSLVVNRGFDSIASLSRGDNFLLDREEDGELDE